MAGGRWWRRPRVAAVAVVAAAASLACAAAAVAPVYPLYAIDSVSGGCSIEDAAVIGRSFSGVQGSYNASVLAALRSAGDVRVVSYIDSDSAKANELEMLAALPLPPNRSSGYVWLGLGFTPLGTLLDAVPAPNSTAPAAAVQARVTVSADAKGPIIATTNPQRPVFLRLGEELLLITGSAPASATHDEEHRDDDAPGGTFLLTLQRAWGNTTAAAHDAGSLAFAPVWNSDGYPGGNSDLAEYIIDPATDLAFDRLVNHTVASLRAGYSGSWFDCFSATLFRSVDMNGNSIEHGVLRNHTLESAWDFAANAWYTKVGVREQHQTLLTAVFNATVSHGVYPTVFANNMGSSYWPGDTSGGSRALLQRSAGFRPLDLYSLERFAGEEINNDKFNSGCRNLSSIKLVYNDPDELQENLAIVADAAQRGLAAGPMIAQAGCKSESLAWMPPAVRDPFEQWAVSALAPAGRRVLPGIADTTPTTAVRCVSDRSGVSFGVDSVGHPRVLPRRDGAPVRSRPRALLVAHWQPHADAAARQHPRLHPRGAPVLRAAVLGRHRGAQPDERDRFWHRSRGRVRRPAV